MLKVLWVGRGLAAGAVLAIVSLNGGHLRRWVPGPAAIEALSIAIIVAAAIATVFLVMEIAGSLAAGERGRGTWLGLVGQPLAAMFVLGSGAFLCWVAVVFVRSLVVIPIAMGLYAWVTLRLVTRTPTDHRLEDPALERRLGRFAGEVGVYSLDIRVWGEPGRSMRTQFDRAPQILVVGRVATVPRDIVDAGYRALEYLLARAIVRRRLRAERWTRLLSFAVLTVGVGLLELTARDRLLRLTGSSSLADPALVPTILTAFIFVRVVSVPLESPLLRWFARREIREVLDLTRDPAGALDAFAYERAGARHFEGWPRRLSGRLSEDEQRREVERWQASRRLCLLFTDIVSSTEHLDRLGDEGWWEVLAEHDHRIRACVAAYGGEEIEKTGDGFLIVFPETGRAVLAAIEAQRRLAGIAASDGRQLEVRMGLHAGDVIRRGTDLVGREVHFAARVASVAAPGQILVSQQVWEDLAGSDRFRFGEPERVTLKGFHETHRVFPAVYETDPAALVAARE